MKRKTFFSRVLAILMALAMILTGVPAVGDLPAGTITAEAAVSVAESNGLAEDIQDGAILHCWCWSFNTIKQNMADIAAAGFTTLQTSPANTCNDTCPNMKIMGNDTVNGTDGCWWWHYQPTDWKIGNYQLGTREDFKAMCQEADKYGIKVIVDVIPNHVTPNLNEVSQNLYNAVGGRDNLFHANGFHEITQWGNRYECTTGQMGGLPDVNTENPDFQYYFLQYLNDLIECGADGFRYDTAKHIGVPSDPTDAKSSRNNFWPVATGMESVKGLTLKDKERIFNYGEVLQGDNVPEAEYAQYMRMTASSYGGKLRSAVQSKNFSTGNISNWQHATPTRLVTWVESHDTYCNAGESVGLSKAQIRLAWAVIAARKDGTPLFFSRPNNSNGWSNRWGDNLLGAKGDNEFKSKEVAAVNFFRNAMAGKSEYLRNPNGSGQILQIDRGTEGTCIINLGGSTRLDNVPTSLADNTYTDQVSGRTFTVSGGKLSGQLDGEKVAVIYNPSASGVSASSVSGSEKFSSATLDIKLSAKNVTNATYTTSEGASGSFTDGTVITVGETLKEGESVTVTLKAQGESGAIERIFTFTKVGKNIAYIDLPSGWSEPYCYAYNAVGAENAAWPGVKMQKVSGNTYKCEIPDNISDPLVIFYGGNNSNRYPADMQPGLAVQGSMIYRNGRFEPYDVIPTITPTVTPTPPETPGVIDGSYDVYIKKPSGWGSGLKCYAYVSETLNNGVWPGVSMVSLGDDIYAYNMPEGWTNAKVIFTDGNRQVPSAMQPGLDWADGTSMLYEDGSWTKVEPVNTLKIESFTAEKQSPQVQGTSIRFDVSASGGQGTLKYRFYRIFEGKTTVFRDYGTGTKAYCNPPAAGTYTICVDVQDESGKVVTEKMDYTWSKKESKPSIKTFTADKVSPQPKGTSVRFDVQAEGGSGALQYRFYRVKDGKTTVFRDYGTGTKAYCNPPVEGTYTIYVDVKDAAGNVATKQMSYTWGGADNEIVIKSFTADKVSPQPKGTSVRLDVTAEGGSGALQYRFYRTGNGKTTVFRDYGSGNKAYCNPPAGTYIIYVDVKDSQGNIKTSSILYEWK